MSFDYDSSLEQIKKHLDLINEFSKKNGLKSEIKKKKSDLDNLVLSIINEQPKEVVDNILFEIIKYKSGDDDLIKAWPLVDVKGVNDNKDNGYFTDCRLCYSNCCFFDRPRSDIGLATDKKKNNHSSIKGPFASYSTYNPGFSVFQKISKVPIPHELKKNMSKEEIIALEERLSNHLVRDLSDRLNLTLNTNWMRIYKTKDGLSYAAACVLLGKDHNCMDYENRFDLCRDYPANKNNQCIKDTEIIHETKIIK